MADSGMELMEVPPEMWPTLMVVAGVAGSLRLAMAVRARLRMRMGLGVPASVQEWPPGPVTVTRKRRLPRARVTTAVVPPPSRAMAAAMRRRVGAALEEMTHAAEVALAFFAYVGGEEDGDGGVMWA